MLYCEIDTKKKCQEKMTETTFTALFLHILIKPSHVNTTLCFPNYIMMSKPKKHSKRFISLCIYVFYYKWVRINP